MTFFFFFLATPSRMVHVPIVSNELTTAPLRGRKETSKMTNLNAAVTTESRPSAKLVTEWSGSINVGIYDNCTWSIRLYEDRAIVRMPGVRWVGSTGGYHVYRTRETGRKLAELLAIAKNEQRDAEDYSREALEVVSQY